MYFDEFKIYCGDDIEITKDIVVTQPTLLQIKEFGEQKYFSSVQTLTSVGADLKWQLWDYKHIDYTTIKDYDLFIQLIYQMVSSKKKIYKEMLKIPQYKEELKNLSKEDIDDMVLNPLELVLKDIDFADFKVCTEDNGQTVLYNQERDITINRFIYAQIVDVVRQIHGFKRNNQLPANERTKMDLIDDARDEAKAMSNQPYKSVLKPLVSALTVKTGQCGDDKILNMKIGMFFDNLKRATKIQDTMLLLQGAYSGFSSLKGIDKSRLDWTGDL